MIHGTKKEKKVKTEQQLKQEEELSTKINSKLADFFLIRKKEYSDEQIPKYMEFTALLMQLCSDIPTIFNFRRELLERLLGRNREDLKAQAEVLSNELMLVAKLIKSDPKSYTLWSFRQWLVQKLYAINRKVVQEEKKLCKMLLMKDEKNFHVWNYRNWVNSVEVDLDEEIAFTEEKIKSNPFNFSPYHFRSKHLETKYLKQLDSSEASEQRKAQIRKFGMPKDVFDQELESVKTAMYLNSNEEAPWIYFRWLMKRLLPVIVLAEVTTENSSKGCILLNQRVRDLRSSLGDEKIQWRTQGLSDKWDFVIPPNSQGKKLSTNIHSEVMVLSEGGMLKPLLSRAESEVFKEAQSEIQSIYRTQEEFIREIIEEEPQCRFANLELLELFKNQLLLSCSEQQWTKMHCEAHQIFEASLGKQAKTQQYIGRLREEWVRISRRETLTDSEQQMII